MAKCPVCGSTIQRDDIRRGGFACPGCKERIRLRTEPGLPTIVGTGLLAFVITYLSGVQGYEFLLVAIIVYLLCFFGAALIEGFFFPTLEAEPIVSDGSILHIRDTPDSSNKS